MGRIASDILRYLAMTMAEASSDPARPARLLLKAIGSLPEREQRFVLRYLIERALVPQAQRGSHEAAPAWQAPHAGVPPLGSGSSEASAAGWGSLGTRAVRLLLQGQTVERVADLYRVPHTAAQAALREVASHPDTPARLSSILRLLAEGRTTAEAASELGISHSEVRDELEALLPSPWAAKLGQALQAAAALQALEPPPGSITLRGSPAAIGRAGQQMLPVRFPEAQYRRLKEWCATHGFSMAVVVRGLVERFLDEQDRRAA